MCRVKASRSNNFCDFASRHSERLLTPNVINNPVIASPSGRGNPIKSTLTRISMKLEFQELLPLPMERGNELSFVLFC